MKTKPWLICLSSGLFFFYVSFEMNMFNALSSSLLKTFSIQAKQLGSLSSAYLYATIISLLPAGWLLDRFSVRRLLLITLAVSFISLFLFSWANSFWQMLLINVLLGTSAAFS